MTIILESDFGTPRSKKTEQVCLEIDGRSITVPADTSIMRAALVAGIDIPKLCSTDSLKAFGSCRLCVIQVDGRNGTPSSCTTPVADGMKVSTHSEKIDRIRKGVMELYLSDHPANCATGDECEVHGIAKKIGITTSRYMSGQTHLDLAKDETRKHRAEIKTALDTVPSTKTISLCAVILNPTPNI